jgi:pyrimidine operon attenuation protein/uracil phosphoribosyltransferase
MKRAKIKTTRVLNGQEIKKSLERFCREILKEHKDSGQLAFIGIRTRGIYLAKRLCEQMKKISGKEVPLGEMDITLYRDDLNTLLPDGKVDSTRIAFDIANKTIILVDDVLHTGRTARAAVDHLIDFGRPKAIHLAVLIDRGGRELPIAADYVGKKVHLPAAGEVKVRLREVDNVDEVVIGRS